MITLRKILVSVAILLFLVNLTATAATKHKVKHKKIVAHRKVHYHQIQHHLVRESYPTHYSVHGSLSLSSTIHQIIQNTDPHAIVGIQIKSMKTGDTLYAHNEHHFFVPASTMKVLTAEAALLYLGPDFTFGTRIVTDAKTINNGVLNGNVYLIHSGDPSLTYNDLTDLIAALKTQDIEGIAGNVYIDNTAYDQTNFGPGWLWSDKKLCYGAPINASIINHNCAYMAPKVKPHKESCRVRIGSSIVTVANCRGHESQTKITSGSVINNVIEYNKSLLRTLFSRFNIHIYGSIDAKPAPQNLTPIATHHSKPLHTLVSEMLKMSDNIIAGSLFKKMGQLFNHQPGSWANGSNAVRQILTRHAAVDMSGMNILDGSGLSRYNQVTPAQLMQALDFAYHNYDINYEFISALPIAGVDGTLKHRLTHIAWKVRAKTGTLSGVRSLAGFTVTKDKEPVAFVIMVNGRYASGWRYKEMEDKIVTAVTNYSH